MIYIQSRSRVSVWFKAFLSWLPVSTARAFKPQLHIYKLSWKVPYSSEAGSWIIQILLWNYRQLGRSCDCDGSTCRTSDYSSFPGSKFASDEEINNNHNANAEDLNNFNSPSNPATIAKAEEEDWHQLKWADMLLKHCWKHIYNDINMCPYPQSWKVWY